MTCKMHTSRRFNRGFSLVEMMVALTVGLVLISVMSVVYVNSKGSVRRQDQLSEIQQSVRTAFEFLSFDGRMLGHLGCFTRHDGLTRLTPRTLTNNFDVGIEGYEYAGTGFNSTFTITSSAPANNTTASSWLPSTGTYATIPIAEISQDPANASVLNGLTPGSDVLIMRTPTTGKPVRLTAPVAGGAGITTLPVENVSTGTCFGGANNMAGFCPNSLGVISSCISGQAFRVTATAGGTLTLESAIDPGTIYPINGSEVFPMQTVIYYIRLSASGTTTSLYRKVLNGAFVDDQELIEGVESMQVRYGVDTTTPDPDGVIDGTYVTADAVADWSRVVAFRVSLLVRNRTQAQGDIANLLPNDTSDRPLNGMDRIVFPAGPPFYDRRVFTTTVALRNRIAYPVP